MVNQQIDLSTHHPDYDRMLRRWIMGYDFYRGGIHVLQPANKIQSISWATRREVDFTTTDSMKARTESAFEFHTSHANSYIHKHEREKLNQWEERCARAYHIPLFRPFVNIMSSAVLKTGPSRQFTGELWSDYLSDVDMDGTSINAFVREALCMSLVFGRFHSITDMSYPENQIKSLADQKAQEIRPYSYHVYPFDLIDWSLDPYNNFRWIVIREDYPDTRVPGQTLDCTYNQFRIWYPDRWELYTPSELTKNREQRSQYVLSESGINPCGKVPLSTIYAHRGGRTLFGVESPFASICDIDRSIFNKLSLLDEILYKQSFAILAVGRREGSPMMDLEIGPNTGMWYDSESGPPVWLSPDANQALALWSIVKDLLSLSRTAAEIGRGQAEQSLESRSAATIGAELGDRNNVMASLAESMEEYEKSLFEMVAKWGNMGDIPSVGYQRKFDLRSISQQITDMTQLKQMQISNRVMAALTSPIVEKMLMENGISKDEIETTLGQLREDLEKEPVEKVEVQTIPTDEDNAFNRAET